MTQACRGACPETSPFAHAGVNPWRHRIGDAFRHDEGVTVRAIHHVQLAMPAGGEQQATAFYAALLGIPRVVKPAHLASRGGCWFETEHVRIHLGIETDFRAARKAHPALLVDGLSALATQLIAAGVAVTSDQPLPGYERVYVDDPFGNRIELMEPISR